MAKRKIFGSAVALVETTLEKTESIVYETLDATEYGFKALTNVMEEFHNDTLADAIASRVASAERIADANKRLKELGFDSYITEGRLQINRRG